MKAKMFLLGLLMNSLLFSQDAVWGDIVISELLVDPYPAAGQEMDEYLEMYNRSDAAFNPCDLVLQVGSREYLVCDSAGLILDPGGYYVRSGISLPNAGSTVILRRKDGEVVHAVRYRTPESDFPWKAEGGWSLEAVDPELYCLISEQWSYSRDPRGGTPGEINSCYALLEDPDPPVFMYYGLTDSCRMMLCFSEALAAEIPSMEKPVYSPGKTHPSAVSFHTPLRDVLQLDFPPGLLSRESFRLDFPAYADCAGNELRPISLLAGWPARPGPGDMVINELMFDPEDGKCEFIELYHAGSSPIDMAALRFGLSEGESQPGKYIPLSSTSHILAPGTYAVLVQDVAQFRKSYDRPLSGNWIGIEDLPALPAKGARLFLSDPSGNSLDVVVYSPEMHLDVLKDYKGVSLERILSEGSGSDPMNWHSAASIEGYCTPGKENSMAAEAPGGSELMHLDPVVFSPGEDGYADLQRIDIAGLEGGAILNLQVFNLKGSLVRQLASNDIAAAEMVYFWDGKDVGGRILKPGFYVLQLEAYHPVSGRKWSGRKASGIN